MNPDILIQINYLTIDSKEEEIVFSPEEYFEEKSEEEKFEVIDIPKFNHAYEYLEIELQQLKNVHLLIKKENNLKEHFYTFWNKGNNYSLAAIHIYNNTKREELILCNVLEESPQKTEILRFNKKENFYIPTSHAIIIDRDGREETIEFKVN